MKGAARAERLERENGGLWVALGKAKGRLEFAQERLRLLEGRRFRHEVRQVRG